MPQDGSNNYQYPPGTPGVPDQTIESEAYNTFLDDLVVNDLNWPRPVHRGGTSSNNAAGARSNLGTEAAAQLVSNYDSHIFEAGSFYSVPGTTGEPVAGQHFSGICYTINFNTMNLEGRVFSGLTPGAKWGRSRSGGTWGAWTPETDAFDSRYVNATGDVMSGGLNLNYANPHLVLNKIASGEVAGIYGFTGAYPRWRVELGDNSTESGSEAGSNFVIRNFNDGGGAMDTPLTIDRKTGLTTVQNLRASTGRIITGLTSSNAAILFSGSSGAYSIYADNAARLVFGTSDGADPTGAMGHFDAAGVWRFTVNGSAFIDASITAIDMSFGTARNSGLRGDGKIMLAGGTVYLDAPTGTTYIQRAGANIEIGGANLFALVNAYKPGGGPFLDSSDARTKNVEGEYPRGLTEIAALRPIYYTFKGNDTNEAPGYSGALDAGTKETIAVPYPNSPHHQAAVDSTRFAGLIAQEAELVIPELVTKRSGYIDGAPVTDLRDLDTAPLIFALINAVKELKARVEALESA